MNDIGDVKMRNIYEQVKTYAEQLQNRTEELSRILSESPKGNLEAVNRHDKVFFAIRWTEDGKRNIKYIKKEQANLAAKYARKYFSKKLLPKLLRNLKAAEYFLKIHSKTDEYDIAEKITPEILDFCSDLYISRVQLINDWKNSKGPDTPTIGAQPSVTTINGELVRSKSEAIIANALYSHNIVYQYERPLYFESRYYTIFPDFTVFNPDLGAEIYWEHFGMMDDPDYSRRTVEKISDYAKNDIIIGKNFICTFEDEEHPLSSANVEQIIKGFLENTLKTK